jgi:LysM repeat protein
MPPAPQTGNTGGGALSGLKHKIGPQPLWAWMAEFLGLALAYALYKNHQASTSAADTSSSDTTPADQTPDVIIQNEFQGPGTTGPTTSPGPVTGRPVIGTPVKAPPVKKAPTKTTKTPPKKPPRKTKEVAPDPIFNGTYTVKAGQTLDEIAKLYKITPEELAHANGFGTGIGLRDGQVLKVPNPAPGGKPNPPVK